MRVFLNGNENRILAFDKNIGRYKLVVYNIGWKETPIWRRSGSDACYYRNKSHGLTLPRLPALLFRCLFSVLRHIISCYYQCEILSLIESGSWELIRKLSRLSVKTRASIFLIKVSWGGKFSKIPVAFSMSSFHERRVRTNGYCSCVVVRVNGCWFVWYISVRFSTTTKVKK